MSVVLFCYILYVMLCYVMCEKKNVANNKKKVYYVAENDVIQIPPHFDHTIMPRLKNKMCVYAGSAVAVKLEKCRTALEKDVRKCLHSIRPFYWRHFGF